MPTFYDTHAHLDYPDFADDLPQVLERAARAGITRIVTIGTDLESSRRAIELSERHAGIYAAVGWHPCHATAAPADLRPALRELARHPRVVAIGETGLDYHQLHDEETEGDAAQIEAGRRKQAELFRQQLEVAAELGLNCVVHQRDAFDDVVAQLRPFSDRVRGVFHCFVGRVNELESVLALGSLVSFTGIVTFKNARDVRDTLAATPPDRFMLETDCPYLAPAPFRGRRCEPAHVREIAEVVAQTRGCSLEELSTATCAVAERFFPKLERG